MNSTIEHPKESITIFAIIHNDIPESTKNTLYDDHFHPFVTELESFTGRRVRVISSERKPYSDFPYKGENESLTLSLWENMAFNFLDEMRAKGVQTNLLTKIILITNDTLNVKVAGIARTVPPFHSGTVAISSLSTYVNVGHEIGHLLGAKHEDAETQYNGWWCDTYMRPQGDVFKSNCYTYSPANRQNIKNYLANYD